MDPFLKVKAARIENALVVIRSAPPGSFPTILRKMLPIFPGPVLYANHLGMRDTAIFSLYPSRKDYYYDFDPVSGKGALSPVFSSLP